MALGRPTKYDPAFCGRVIEYGTQGMGVCEMASELKIGWQAFNSYRKQHEEFSLAVKEALCHSQAWWEGKGRTATFDATGFSATSYIFQMKNRFPDEWRDRKEHELSGKDGAPLIPEINVTIGPESSSSSETG